MITLNEKQFQFIQSKLEESPLKYKPLKEELLDHLCSDIEFKMAEGASFSQATLDTFDTFQEDEMQEIEQHSMHLLNQNTVIMKRVSLLGLSFLFVVILIWSIQEESPIVPNLEELPPIAYLEKEPPSISPLEKSFEVVSGYGKRMHPKTKVLKLHEGVDFIAPMGTPIYATSDGVIEKVDTKRGRGLHVIIKHDETYQTLYFHLSKIDVIEGQDVKKGDIIGAVGETGNTTGPCLHYEIHKDGKSVDPEPYLEP